MNREIIFKAKRVDNGEWVEGSLIITEGSAAYIIRSKSKAFIPKGKNIICSAECYEINIETLCQYTGLTDKNGKKIWENDILRRDGYWDIRIEFENGAFMVRNADKIQYINRVTYTFISTFDIKEYEVIGNIFDGGFNDGKRTKEN